MDVLKPLPLIQDQWGSYKPKYKKDILYFKHFCKNQNTITEIEFKGYQVIAKMHGYIFKIYQN